MKVGPGEQTKWFQVSLNREADRTVSHAIPQGNTHFRWLSNLEFRILGAVIIWFT